MTNNFADYIKEVEEKLFKCLCDLFGIVDDINKEMSRDEKED